jgi:hypothetical protein
VSIAAFPLKALDRMIYPPDFRLQRRKRLALIVADHRVTPTTIVAALEGAGDGCHGVSGVLFGDSRTGLDVRNYG